MCCAESVRDRIAVCSAESVSFFIYVYRAIVLIFCGSAPCEYLCGSFFFLTRFAAYLLQRRLLFVLGQVYSVFIADRLTVCLLQNVLSVLNNGFRFSLCCNGIVQCMLSFKLYLMRTGFQ